MSNLSYRRATWPQSTDGFATCKDGDGPRLTGIASRPAIGDGQGELARGNRVLLDIGETAAGLIGFLLAVPQCGVETVLRQQAAVRPAFGDATLIENDDM